VLAEARRLDSATRKQINTCQKSGAIQMSQEDEELENEEDEDDEDEGWDDEESEE
jgi:hypothetical protein